MSGSEGHHASDIQNWLSNMDPLSYLKFLNTEKSTQRKWLKLFIILLGIFSFPLFCEYLTKNFALLLE